VSAFRQTAQATGKPCHIGLVIRFLQRLTVVGLGALSVWLIVFVVFRISDHRLPWILALAVTYGVGAYVILPLAVRMGLKVLQRKHVPAYTLTGDGLPGDPVNMVLVGTLGQLEAAFGAAGWSGADRLSLSSSWRMTRAFLLNEPYPTAPFSTLFLFGRGQDTGFQKAIGDSPRKRHHIRFWAMSLAAAETTLGSASFWSNADAPAENERVLWVGAGTRDTGLGLTQFTFKITHATDAATSDERDFIIAELARCAVIGEVSPYGRGEHLAASRVNHYVTDGYVSVAELTT
jgi:hypothetical protein